MHKEICTKLKVFTPFVKLRINPSFFSTYCCLIKTALATYPRSRNTANTRRSTEIGYPVVHLIDFVINVEEPGTEN